MSEDQTLYDQIGQFATIPHTVIRMSNQIGMDALGVFVYLRYRTGNKTYCFPSIQTMEYDLGINRRRVVEAIKKLEKYGLLERQKRFSDSTIYTLKMPSISTGEILEPASISTGETPVFRQVKSNKIHLTRFNLNTREEIKNPPEEIRESSQDEQPEVLDDLPPDIKARQPKQILRTSHTKEELLSRSSSAIAIFGNNHKNDRTCVDFSRFPPDVVDLARKFVELHGVGPVGKSSLSRWIEKLKEQVAMGITPEDLEVSYKKSIKDGLPVKDPGSLTTNAYGNKRKEEKKVDSGEFTQMDWLGVTINVPKE